MGKIEQNKEKKRQAILTSAQEIFLSEGYVLASMDKIAANAKMTKQTVYRYFPSKVDLFQATLRQIGKSVDNRFLRHLQDENTKKALLGFAKEFLYFHLSPEHLSIFRLLVAESAKAPEIIDSFLSVRSDNTNMELTTFFSQRLKIQDTESIIRLWTGMLLSLRSEVLMGMENPSQQQIETHAETATEFLLSAIT